MNWYEYGNETGTKMRLQRSDDSVGSGWETTEAWMEEIGRTIRHGQMGCLMTERGC